MKYDRTFKDGLDLTVSILNSNYRSLMQERVNLNWWQFIRRADLTQRMSVVSSMTLQVNAARSIANLYPNDSLTRIRERMIEGGKVEPDNQFVIEAEEV